MSSEIRKGPMQLYPNTPEQKARARGALALHAWRNGLRPDEVRELLAMVLEEER